MISRDCYMPRYVLIVANKLLGLALQGQLYVLGRRGMRMGKQLIDRRSFLKGIRDLALIIVAS